MVLVGNGKASV
jgi:hypothetical protein